ncbi:hypothetical protein ACTFIU_004802 [Dictyostelium citrinum]
MKIIFFVFFITFFISFSFVETLEKEQCEFIKNQDALQPKSIYISYYKNNNARIDFLKLENNSKSFQVFQSNQNILHGVEFLSITSNTSILVKTNNENTERLQWGNASTKSFSFKWDNELFQPFYTIDQCYNKNMSNVNSNNSFDLSFGRLTAMVVSGTGNFSILNGNIQGDEKQFEYQSNIKVKNDDIKYFKSSFDIENNIHYSLIYDNSIANNNSNNNINNNNNSNSNIYLIVTNLNNISLINDSTVSKPTTTFIVSVIIPNMEFKSMGISGYNNTIVIAGFDKRSNSTKFYSVDIINNKLNDNSNNSNTTTTSSNTTIINNNFLQSNITLLFEKNYTISNFVKSLNSKYLMVYFADSKLVSVYNIKDKTFYLYSNLEINIPDGYSMVELFSSGFNETVIKTTSIDNSNKSDNSVEGNKKNKNKQTTIIIVSVIIVACILGLIGGAIFLIIKKRNSRVSFKRLDKDRELHKYPQDNITILLQNYK